MYALVDFAFANVNRALQDPQQWCEVMILHLNTKYCHAITGVQGQQILPNIGSKSPQTLSQSPRVTLTYTLVTCEPDYFEGQLGARNGPMGTRDFQSNLEAVALATGQTFLHLTYAYNAHLAARLAMQTYLATVGSHKVGFCVLGQATDGAPLRVKGVQALVEHNTMRYYLAIKRVEHLRQQTAQ